MGRGKRRGVVSLGLTLVAAGSAAGLGILALTVAPTVVIGEVRAADGSPASHVPVSAGAHTAFTDASGRYMLTLIPRRTRELTIDTTGFVPITTRLRSDRGFIERLDLRLDHSPRVFGRVLDEAGAPLADARVMLFVSSRFSPEQLPKEATTVEKGSFLFEDLPVGEAVIRVERVGYVTSQEQLTLNGETRYQRILRLERERGQLRVVTEPAGATIAVTGSPAGCTSPCELVLESGDYHITVSVPKFVPLEVDTQIFHKQATVLMPKLERMMGHLQVTGPAGATVLLNGAAVGQTPWEADLPTDPYTVQVLAAHHWPGWATAEVRWRENTAVEIATPGFSRHPDRATWLAGLEGYVARLEGRYGVAVMDLDGGAPFGAHMDEIFTAASVNKLPIAVTVYREVEAGRLKMEDEWEMLPGDVTSGTGVLKYKAPGNKFTVRELLETLIRQSDNTAASMFRRVLGNEKIDANMAELGAPNTRQLGVTTPRETLGLLALVWRGQLLTADHRDELLTLLKTTAFNDRISAGVPAGIPVAHKIGTYGSAVNDVGIVFATRPYIVCVFTNTGDWDGAVQAIRTISAALYEFEL